jgi:hypothetical protein
MEDEKTVETFVHELVDRLCRRREEDNIKRDVKK